MHMIGLHINSNIDMIQNEITKYHNLGCNAIQLFVDPFNKNDVRYNKFASYANKNNIKLIVHMPYNINIAQQWNQDSHWIKHFILEIIMAKEIGAYAVVVHLGKKLKLSDDEALNNMYTSLLYIHNETYEKANDVKIFIETSTGQGTEMCYKIEDFAYFYRKISNNKNEKVRERFGICFDTCHVFAAGHDISNKNKIEYFFDLFNELIGIKNIKLVHFNDSKKELGSNVDRHASIGKGFIGKNGLIIIAKFFMKLEVPIILETPDEYINEEIKMLIGLKKNYDAK